MNARDLAYREALGVRPGQPIPATLGTVPPSGASASRRRRPVRFDRPTERRALRAVGH